MEPGAFEHDVFVVYADADEPFVHGHLLPALGLPAERVLLSSRLPPGAPRTAAIERGVQASRLTVLVLTPAYMTDRWAELGEQLAGHAGRAEGRLVPLLRADCDLPLRLDALVPLDFRNPADWSAQAGRLRARLELPEPPRAPELPCPYPGMRPYSTEGAAHFRGRDAEIEEVLGRLRAGERELYVIGPSGSGKSSLVHAGVLPRLARGAPGLPAFAVRSMRPGEEPTGRLGGLLEGDVAAPAAAASALLARHAPGAQLLLVIDQLEELFTLAPAGERDAFLAALRGLRAEPRCVLVLTLRADFYGALMESPLWQDLAGRICRIDVAPLRGAALRAAIEEPARELGVHFEPELLERLVADAASEPGILPLLQDALIQLWERRRLRLLTLADYEALGDGGRSGLAVAIARRADATVRALAGPEEVIARRILLRLVSFGEGRSNTRRQQPVAALRATGDDPARFDAVLRRLVGDRLLTIDGDGARDDARVDLAHEAMISAWPTLAGWISTRRVDEQRRRQLEATAAQWDGRGRGDGGLLDEIELAEAEAWRRTESARELGESPAVAALIAASRAARDHQQRRHRARVAIAVGALGVFAVVVSTLALLERRQAGEAERQRRDAIEQRRQAEAARGEAEDRRRDSQRRLAASYQETGRQLVIDDQPLQALPYLAAARAEGADGPALRMLFRAATRNLPLAPPLVHPAQVVHVAFSADGARVITASKDRAARIWDAATGQPAAPPLEHETPIRRVALGPGGARALTATWFGELRLWDTAGGKRLGSPVDPPGTLLDLAFGPDGPRAVNGGSREAQVWDAATGKPIGPPLVHQAHVWHAAFSPDGARLVTLSGDGTVRVWDAATGQPLAPPFEDPSDVALAAVSPDGARVLTAAKDGAARIRDAATGRPLGAPLAHRAALASAAFSLDGTRVVTASEDRTVRLWDAATGRPLAPPLEHRAAVTRAAFSPDGARVVTGCTDDTAWIWDAAPAAGPTEQRGTLRELGLARDSGFFVGQSEGVVRVWSTARVKPRSPPLAHRGPLVFGIVSPDGRLAITGSTDRIARIWDAATGALRVELAGHEGALTGAAFSPDGARVVTASLDRTARIWDAVTGKPLGRPLEHRDVVRAAAFSPDGRRVVTASDDWTAQLWDTATGAPVTPPLEHRSRVNDAAFSPDGARVVTSSDDRIARVWDAATGKPLTGPLAHRSPARRIAFSPDGLRVAVEDSTYTTIWELPLEGGTAAAWAAIAERGLYRLAGDVLAPRAVASSGGPGAAR